MVSRQRCLCHLHVLRIQATTAQTQELDESAAHGSLIASVSVYKIKCFPVSGD